MRVAVPAALHIPEPGLVPQHNHAKYEAVQVVDTAPGVLAELDQRRRLVLGPSQAPPALDLALAHVSLLGQRSQL